MKVTTLLLATTLTFGTAVTASAINTSGKANGRSTTIHDQRDAGRHELRQRINPKHREYVSLRQAGDPRAEGSLRELQALKAEWKQRYGGKNAGDARSDISEGKRHGKHNKNKNKQK